MKASSGFGPGRGQTVLWIVVWALIVVIGIGLVSWGFNLDKSARQSSSSRQATATPTVTSPLPLPTTTIPPIPTNTPLPTATPLPTPSPATPTPVVPMALVTNADGVNTRSGPGTNFTLLGHLDPNAQVPVTGRYSDWWQILYNGANAWVFGQYVSVSDAETVQQVVPPASPVPAAPPQPTATPAPTAIPATATPANVHGLVATSYIVEKAPGPYAVNAEIWFSWVVLNQSSSTVEYSQMGTFVDETNTYQSGDGIPGHASYTNSSVAPNQAFPHRDHVHFGAAGTYHLWLAVTFGDGQFFKLKGPVTVTVQ